MAKRNAKTAPAEVSLADIKSGSNEDKVVFRLLHFWKNKGGMLIGLELLLLDEKAQNPSKGVLLIGVELNNCLTAPKSLDHHFQAENKVAQACYLAGELRGARKHCEASIKILKRLYEDEHVMIGNEMLKLASIQLASGDSNGAWDPAKRLFLIFSKYYGSHAETLFSYLPCLKQEAAKAVNL